MIVGVSDNGNPVGVGVDGFSNEDKMTLHLENIVISRIGQLAMTFIHPHFEDYDGCRVLIVRCTKSLNPIFVKDGDNERFYARMAASTRELRPSEIPDYIKSMFKS